MGTVYLAQHRDCDGLQGWVALKVLHSHLADDERMVTMFLDEAAIGARLQHRNVCQVLDWGWDGARPYMALEYLHGLSLTALTRRIGLLPFEVGLRLVADAARGLHYAHELRDGDGAPSPVVHRDVSPENIVVLFDGFAKVVDFGIAHARGRSTQTQAGELKGKLGHLAPEQVVGGAMDRRTDVWALGVVLWEAVTGEPLFKAETLHEHMYEIVQGPIPSPVDHDPSCPAPLELVTMMALQRDPRHRPADAGQLADALEDILDTRGMTTTDHDLARWLCHHVRTPRRRPKSGTVRCRGS
jgi:serine/threonine-protein kinase